MPNSIPTTSNTPTATNATPTTFKVGDAVLCPSIGHDSPRTFLDAQVTFAKSRHAKRKPSQSPAGGI